MIMITPRAEGPHSSMRALRLQHVQASGRDCLDRHSDIVDGCHSVLQQARTLHVPSLVPEGRSEAFRPSSVLLLLAGTGAVALPQILQHRYVRHTHTTKRERLNIKT